MLDAVWIFMTAIIETRMFGSSLLTCCLKLASVVSETCNSLELFHCWYYNSDLGVNDLGFDMSCLS